MNVQNYQIIMEFKMKNIYLKKNTAFMSITMLILAFTVQSFAQNVTTPRPVSPAAELKQKIGLTDITVNYSRPRVTLRGNDRTGKIWGQQIPYGFNKINFACNCEIPWRAGANENTTITFTDDVKIEGKDLPAGKYGLHMAVFKDERVTVIFSKTNSAWGSFFYDQKDDALRVDVKAKPTSHTEVLTYNFVDMGNNFGVLALSWEKKMIPFKIEVDVHKVVLANFRNELKSLPAFGWRGYFTAANYCLNNNINHEEALKWADTAVQRNKAYNTLAVKAGLLIRSQKIAEGEKVLDEAMPMANKNQLNALGYQLLGIKRFQKAIAAFKLNAKNNPTDPNMFDSLGEAYKQAGDKENAIKNLKKALSMNPPANVKANSEKLLKELGAM